MSLPAPVLVQLGEPARRIAPPPSLDSGRDGLLRRKGAATPIVEELLGNANELGTEERSLWLSTVMTKGFDNPDPSLPRRGVR
jgi:hypothetical protein